VAPHVKAGRIVAVGVAQEQHPDRTRLYAQWKRLDWPVFVDALNLLDHSGVPIPMGLDESGVVRRASMSPEALDAFLSESFPASTPAPVCAQPNPATLANPRDRGDALFHHGGLNDAIEAYRAAVEADPRDARAHFRLGVALRRRADAPDRKPADAQEAAAEWGAALALNPNQYIWRRRIQQYGPRLDKPYDFYFWVEQARREIRARGEEPVALAAEPAGSEIAAPLQGGTPPRIPDPDPNGNIPRDPGRRVGIEPTVVPAAVRPGGRVRVRLTLRPVGVLWDNEDQPMRWSFKIPSTLKLVEADFAPPVPRETETKETRTLEAEFSIAGDAAAGEVRIPSYVLYSVCDEEGGTCQLLRQDVTIEVRVDPSAAEIRK
jgi:hypothetical protein